MVIRKLTVVVRSMVGLWLGLWTIAGLATFVAGLLILALQLYGHFHLGFWARLTPAGILQSFNIAYPVVPWEIVQKSIDCALRLPIAAVFIWCGFHLTAMAWIARKKLEKKACDLTELILRADERYAERGISSLQVRR